jgi:hypothetical protein
MVIAETILSVCLLYLTCGVLLGVPFVLRGVERIDYATRGTSLGFRLLLLPGSIALWPLLAASWWRALKRGEHS